MQSIKMLVPVMLLVLLSGCAATPNVSLNQGFWHNHRQVVKVAKTKAAPVGLYQEGQEGILDIAINQMTTNNFRQYLRRTDMRWYSNLQHNFVSKLRQHGIKAVASNYPVRIDNLSNSGQNMKQYAKYNFKPLATRIGGNRLLLIDAKQVGAVRSYYGFIPTSAPKAVCNLEGRLVDLNNNRILWRYNANVVMPVSGKWDQAPNYPNFTRALNKAIHVATNEVMTSFFANN